MKPVISIIIPCYNCEKTIEYAIESVEKGGIDDYEIILVNDGSKDSTLSILNKRKSHNERCCVITQDNAGVSSARNTGLDNCKGEYIIFLDSDDILSEGYLALVKNLLKKNNVDALSCYRTTDARNLQHINNITNSEGKEIEIDKLLKEFTLSKRVLGFTTFVYKMSIVREHNITFDTDLKYGEDWEFTTKYLAHCNNAVLYSKPCYYYRPNEESATHFVTYQQTDAITAAIRTWNYLREMNHDFATYFFDYMYPRTIFSIMHRFAKANQIELLKRVEKEFDVKSAMKKILCNKDVDWQSRLVAMAYLVSPNWYMYICCKF